MGAGNHKTHLELEGEGIAERVITADYRQLLKEAHAEPGWGTSAQEHIEDVCALISEYEAEDVLDYGCGKAVLSEVLDVTNYDPATYPTLPKPHDLVLCIDVMEHVERECVDSVLMHIRSLTKKAAFLVISCQPAVKKLADGRNAHITIEKPEWWMEKLREHGLEPHKHITPGDGKALFVICHPV
jgi:2-polyprenyl-3-methyl-5-hydroxy-6-metoxy-1,4-benzoquinol methylase